MDNVLLILLIPSFLTVLGDILIALSVFNVHNILSQEKSIDQKVVYEVKKEKKRVKFGIMFLAIGYMLEVYIHISS